GLCSWCRAADRGTGHPLKSPRARILNLCFNMGGLMPTQDEIMQQIINLVGGGAGTTLSAEVQDALRERYYAWITRKKKNVPTSPQDIWDAEAGKKIQKQLEKIGKHLAGKK